MANKKSAIKAIRKEKKRGMLNQVRKSIVKTNLKYVRDAVQNKEQEEKVLQLFSNAQSSVSKAVSKGTLHKNTASRKISRLSALIKKHFDSKK